MDSPTGGGTGQKLKNNPMKFCRYFSREILSLMFIVRKQSRTTEGVIDGLAV